MSADFVSQKKFGTFVGRQREQNSSHPASDMSSVGVSL